MAWITDRELKVYHLEQLVETAEHDGALRYVLAAAEAFIRTDLGYDFAAAASGTRVIYGDGGLHLVLPDNGNTATLVTAPAGYTVPTYEEVDGVLVVADTLGVLSNPVRPSLYDAGWPWTQAWQQGVPYTVTATYGYGTVPADIKMVCAEIAVQLWRRRDLGGSEVLGVEGASAITIRNSLSPLSRSVLDAHKRTSIGVW